MDRVFREDSREDLFANARVSPRRARVAASSALNTPSCSSPIVTADPIPISESVIGAWARLISDCRAAGVQRMVNLTGALIAATAIDLGLPVVTRDDDYDQMARADRNVRVLRS